KTPLGLPVSSTVSCCPSNLKTACRGAMNGSLSSRTSPSPTSRPTLVSSLTRTKSAERLPSRAMADTRARGLLGAGALAETGLLMPVTGFGGGGGAGREEVGGLVAPPAAGALAGAAGADCLAGAGFIAGAAAAPGRAAGFAGALGCAGCSDGPVAPSGVPQRAQNLKVAALSVMQLGHCLGGAPCCSRPFPVAETGVFGGFCIMVGTASSSPIGAPQERHEPTSVSLCAPQRGQSMASLLCPAAKRGQGARNRGWCKPARCANLS